MQTVLFGQNRFITKLIAKNKKKIELDGKEVEVFTAKPMLIYDEKLTWEEMYRWDGQPHFNSNCTYVYPLKDEINISENEVVRVIEKIFRADLNELHLHSDKVLKEEVNDDCEDKYKRFVKEFNKQMIESNEKLKERCDLYNLSYEDTDCEKLFKDVYGTSSYKIVDGKMVEFKDDNNKYDMLTTANKNGKTHLIQQINVPF